MTHVMNELYVEYSDQMSGENPFVMGGKKYQFVWAKYSNGRRDIGVYAFEGDVTFGYLAWREMNNLS